MIFYTSKEIRLEAEEKTIIASKKQRRLIFSPAICRYLNLNLGDSVGLGYNRDTNEIGISLLGDLILRRVSNESLGISSKWLPELVTPEGKDSAVFKYKAFKDGVYLFEFYKSK